MKLYWAVYINKLLLNPDTTDTNYHTDDLNLKVILLDFKTYT